VLNTDSPCVETSALVYSYSCARVLVKLIDVGDLYLFIMNVYL
jgi:hypothetical protein